MSPRSWVALGALLAGLAVAAGAFGAHGLRARLSPDMLQVFETAARYQMYHALALIAVGLMADRWPSPLLGTAGWLFLAGIVLFQTRHEPVDDCRIGRMQLARGIGEDVKALRH